MAERRGGRETFFSPAKVSFDRRGQVIVDARDQRLDERPHRVGPDEERLLPAALMEQAVREGVAAVEVRGDLDLVHRAKARSRSRGMASTVETR